MTALLFSPIVHEAQAQDRLALAIGRDRRRGGFRGRSSHRPRRGRGSGTPSFAVTTMPPICSSLTVRPRPWTSSIWLFCSMLPPPTFRLFFSRASTTSVERQAVLDQPVGIDADLILLFVAAPGVDLGHARDGAQLRLDRPVVDRAEVRQLLSSLGLGHRRRSQPAR